MAITISGSGITSANIADGTIVNADVADVAASKLTGALPAIDGSALTNLPSPSKSYRYWKYYVVASLVSHHPNSSRLIMEDEGGTSTNIHTYRSDNCSDSGTIATNGTSYTYDFGSPTVIKRVGCYCVYSGGTRASWIKVFGSTDNSTWVDMGTTAVYAIGCGITLGDI